MKRNFEDQYVNIQGWMRCRLNLKGTRLIAYAVVYGFSQDGDTWFTGRLSYIQNWAGVGATAARKALYDLCDEGLIERQEVDFGGVMFPQYRTVKRVPPSHSEVPPSHSEVPPSHSEVPPSHSEVPPSHSEGTITILDTIGDTIEENSTPVAEDDGDEDSSAPENLRGGQPVGNQQNGADAPTPSSAAPPSPPERKSRTAELNDKAQKVLDYWNNQVRPGKRPLTGKVYLKHIRARISDGATGADCAAVIKGQALLWAHDPKMKRSFNLTTLFRESNFPRYLDDWQDLTPERQKKVADLPKFLATPPDEPVRNHWQPTTHTGRATTAAEEAILKIGVDQPY